MAIVQCSSHVDWQLPAEFNIYRAAELSGELQQALSARVPVHCHLDEVEELDASGVQLLLLAEQETRRLGTTLLLRAPSAPCVEALGILGLAYLLEDRS